jgi:long-chain acyl-CoA synthetase
MEPVWLDHYPPGIPADITEAAARYGSLVALFEESCTAHADRTAYYSLGASMRYAELEEYSRYFAAWLQSIGLNKGDRVALMMPNVFQYPVCLFGVLRAGGVVVNTNPLYTPPEIEYQANDSGMELMFVMTNYYKTIKTAQPKTKIKKLIVTNLKETLPPVLRTLFTLAKEKKGGFRIEGGLAEGDIWFQDLLKKHAGAPRPKIEVTSEDVAMFQYSGGTTGVSKAAVAVHRNIIADTLQIKSWMPGLKDGGEVVLMAIPLFHVYGMVAGMLFAIASAASMVMIPNPRDIPDVLHSIQKFRPSIFPGVPSLYNAINNHPDVKAGKINLSSIKACISGSAPLMRETKETFERLSGGIVFEGYGLSEAPTASHCNPLNGINKTGSIGMPLPDVDCKIISLDDGETEMPIGEIGELVLNGPQVMKGYHNMPTETANTLRTRKDGKIWLFTGDIARMDEDGYFYIVDRKKELIKPGGYQVWPREVEEVLITHPKVMDVGVAGIPDAYRGETVKAWLVLKPGETVTAEELKAFCKERLAAYKVPTHYEFRKELPKTTVGKILRRELVRQHKEANQ